MITDTQWDFALYGLRNLSVMDEEETRIMDMIDEVEPTVRFQVKALVDGGEYEEAYVVAIWALLKDETSEEVTRRIDLWVAGWNEEQQADEPEEQLGDEMFSEYVVLKSRSRPVD